MSLVGLLRNWRENVKGFRASQHCLYLYYKPMENWKDVVGYEGRYQVSDTGRIRSLLTDRIMKTRIAENGYERVGLSNGKRGDGTGYSVHRLVGMAFLDK